MECSPDHMPDQQDFWRELDHSLAECTDLETMFRSLSDGLVSRFAVKKGLLAACDGDGTRLMAVAAWREGRELRRLSLRLPQRSSFLQTILKQQASYTESYMSAFDGNHLERNLLLDDDSASYLIQPLRCDGCDVGVIAYSSDDPLAFVTIDETTFEWVTSRLAKHLRSANATDQALPQIP